MSEMKSAVFSMAIFVGVIVPFLLYISVMSLHQHAFMKVTTEVTEVVKEEGGITSKVTDTIQSLEDRGYTISFKNEDGGALQGRQDFGKSIIIDFDYQYNNVRGMEELHTQNVVFVNRR